MESLIGLVVLAVLAVPALLIATLVMIGGLKRRVGALEAQVAALDAMRERDAGAVAGEPTLADWMRAQPAAQPVQDRATPAPASKPTPPEAEPVAATQSTPPPLPPASSPRPIPPVRPSAPSRPDPLTLAARAVRHWFTEGNVPVKVGVLVLFAGVAALLKYASDQGWMNFPIELRLAGVALAALGGLVFGWRQREGKRSFALSLQGGAIGVLLLVVFAAFKFYDLLPAGAAFGLSVVIVAGAGVLAVMQNAIALALLGILAGFLAPIWLSTGSGNHVALFGYYAVLNAAIFAIAWWRSWRMLNLLGFVFTFGIGTVWGVWNYKPEHFDTTEPFLLLFFVFYLLIPILYARRRPAARRDLVDGCLVFGTPLIAFSLQAGLLQGERMPLAFCSLALGALYAGLAWWLQRREHYAALAAPFALLAVGFATLAVPLALSAQATASVFALEGAALVWLGLRQQRRLPQMTGLLLQLLAAGSFAIGVSAAAAPLPAVLNARFMGALLIALAGFASAWSYRRSSSSSPIALLYYLWGLAWWVGNGLTEIERYLEHAVQADAMLAFAAVTGWIAAEIHARLPARALAWTTIAVLASALPLAFAQDIAHVRPIEIHALLAWALYLPLGWRSLVCLRDRAGAELGLAHALWLWAGTLLWSLLMHNLTLGGRGHLGDGWVFAAIALPWLFMAAMLQLHPQRLAAPLQARFAQWHKPLQLSLMLVLVIGGTHALFRPGDSTPLPWLPILNPLDLVQIAALGLVSRWLTSDLAPADLRSRRIPLLAAAAFALITVITLRATHHWGGVPWNGAMLSTSLVQTSLTIVWSVLGVLGWIIGSRRGQRGLWLAGAVLMAVVLAKLVLVDRQHLGNLLGIASFIAYGLLCTAVGYFAPAPPRATPDSDPLVEEPA